MDYIISAVTDTGISKETNQDSYAVKSFNTSLGKMVLAVLCDGMGGLSKGEVASASLVNAFSKWGTARLHEICDLGQLSQQIISDEWIHIANEFNEKIKIYGSRSGISVGTTLTAMLITPALYYVINVGDTRAYEIADNLTIITKDQTVVAREVELGRLSPEQAERDPRRNVLLQCVGASDYVYPDMCFGETKQNALYMLCSDGFRHEISGSEIYETLHPSVMTDVNTMNERGRYLIDLNKQRMERDNMTVISIRTY